MTEDDAKTTIQSRVPRETFDKIHVYVSMLADAATQQNLISVGTLSTIWSRHILDSAQLAWLGAPTSPLLDIGSGAGLPGIILALISPGAVTLSEPRALRVDFLRTTVFALGLEERVDVQPLKIQRIAAPPFATITARAVAPLADVFAWAAHCADADTRWILPRGRSAREDVALAERLWHGRYEIVPSLTDSHAAIVIAQGVKRRGLKSGKSR